MIKRKAGKNATADADAEDDEEDTEESWTFVGGDDPDPDAMTKKLSDSLVGMTVGGVGGGENALGSQILKV